MKIIACLVLIGATLFAHAGAFRLKRAAGDYCKTDGDCDALEACVPACECPITHDCWKRCFPISTCNCGEPDCHYGPSVVKCDCSGGTCVMGTDDGGLHCTKDAATNTACTAGNAPCIGVSNYCNPDDGVCYCNYMYDDDNAAAGDGCATLASCDPWSEICDDSNGQCYEEDTADTFECDCDTGYHISEDGNSCITDACSPCDEVVEEMYDHMHCDLTEGVCVCNVGYNHPSDDPCDPCVDINECDNDTLCGDDASCTNVPGSFLCACDEGFTGNGFDCEDIIECHTPSSTCDRIADCVDMGRSMFCRCPDGYNGDGGTCYDDIECGTRVSDCDDHATCKDAFGKYECRCDPGWEGDGTYCEDIKECERHLHHCDPRASCMDDCNGSYTCTCNDGYVGSGYMGDCRRKHGGSSSGGHGHRGRGHRHHGHRGSGSGGSGGGGGMDVSIENNVSVGSGGGGRSSSSSSSSGSR